LPATQRIRLKRSGGFAVELRVRVLKTRQVMDLQALGNIGEFVGAIGVIASLVYLANQVRRAHLVARAESIGELMAGPGVQLLLAGDADAARIYHIGNEDPSRLDAVELERFNKLLGLQLLWFIQVHVAHQGGLVDGDLYEVWVYSMAWELRTPGASKWWLAVRAYYPADVVRAIDEVRDTAEFPDILAPLKGLQEGDSSAP